MRGCPSPVYFCIVIKALAFVQVVRLGEINFDNFIQILCDGCRMIWYGNGKENLLRGILMRRTAILIFIFLTTTISSMLFWQWTAYSKQDNTIDDDIEKVVQEITVKTETEKLHITQKIIGLTSDKEYRVTIPETLFDWSCTKGDGEACEPADENPLTFLPEKEEMIFQYTIPIPKGQVEFFLNEWTTSLSKVSVAKTDIKIIASAKRDGSWVAGAPLKGFKKMDLIDFYSFSGIGDTPSLYWQPGILYNTQSKKRMDLYSTQQRNDSFNLKVINSLTDFPFVAVVFSDRNIEYNGRGLIVTSLHMKEDELKRKLINNYFESSFNFEERWLLDILTSYTAKVPAETAKGKAVLNELNNKLSEEERKAFFNHVKTSNGSITTKLLDSYIKEIKGANTRFFTLNKDESSPFVPLYCNDTRKVIIAEKEQKELEVVVDDGKMLYPFIDTMTELGFEVKTLPDQETIILIKESNTYRFYINSHLFIYNEEDYGLLERPLTNLNGKIYISKQWIKELFKVSIEEGETEIKLKI